MFLSFLNIFSVLGLTIGVSRNAKRWRKVIIFLWCLIIFHVLTTFLTALLVINHQLSVYHFVTGTEETWNDERQASAIVRRLSKEQANEAWSRKGMATCLPGSLERLCDRRKHRTHQNLHGKKRESGILHEKSALVKLTGLKWSILPSLMRMMMKRWKMKPLPQIQGSKPASAREISQSSSKNQWKTGRHWK